MDDMPRQVRLLSAKWMICLAKNGFSPPNGWHASPSTDSLCHMDDMPRQVRILSTKWIICLVKYEFSPPNG